MNERVQKKLDILIFQELLFQHHLLIFQLHQGFLIHQLYIKPFLINPDEIKEDIEE